MNDGKSEACFRPKPVSQLQHAFFKCVHIFANVCIRKTKLELEEAVSSEDAQEQLVVFFLALSSWMFHHVGDIREEMQSCDLREWY